MIVSNEHLTVFIYGKRIKSPLIILVLNDAEGSNLPVWFLHSKSGLLRDRFLLSCFTFFILFPSFLSASSLSAGTMMGLEMRLMMSALAFSRDADFHFDLRDGAFGDRAFVYFGDVGFFESEGLDSDGDALEGSEAEFEVGCVGFFEEGCCFFFVSFFLTSARDCFSSSILSLRSLWMRERRFPWTGLFLPGRW